MCDCRIEVHAYLCFVADKWIRDAARFATNSTSCTQTLACVALPTRNAIRVSPFVSLCLSPRAARGCLALGGCLGLGRGSAQHFGPWRGGSAGRDHACGLCRRMGSVAHPGPALRAVAVAQVFSGCRQAQSACFGRSAGGVQIFFIASAGCPRRGHAAHGDGHCTAPFCACIATLAACWRSSESPRQWARQPGPVGRSCGA